jgi:hypothetical protein
VIEPARHNATHNGPPKTSARGVVPLTPRILNRVMSGCPIPNRQLAGNTSSRTPESSKSRLWPQKATQTGPPKVRSFTVRQNATLNGPPKTWSRPTRYGIPISGADPYFSVMLPGYPAKYYHLTRLEMTDPIVIMIGRFCAVLTC